MMKLVFRFPLQKGKSRDEDYEVASIPPVEERLYANNQLIYKVIKITWEVDVDKKRCFPVVWLDACGEWDPDEPKYPQKYLA